MKQTWSNLLAKQYICACYYQKKENLLPKYMNLSLPLKLLFLQYLCTVIVWIYYFELAFIFQFSFNFSLSFNNFVKRFCHFIRFVFFKYFYLALFYINFRFLILKLFFQFQATFLILVLKVSFYGVSIYTKCK